VRPLAILWLWFSASAEITLFKVSRGRPFDARYWFTCFRISSSNLAKFEVSVVPLVVAGLVPQLKKKKNIELKKIPKARLIFISFFINNSKKCAEGGNI
jgi:hypothetical protein